MKLSALIILTAHWLISIAGVILIMETYYSYNSIDLGCFQTLGNTENKARKCEDVFKLYVERGSYISDVHIASQSIKEYFKNWHIKSSKSNPKDIVIFDIDETAISNIPLLLKDDFQYYDDDNSAFQLQANASALIPVLNAYKFIYSQSISVGFITGRSERFRNCTEHNLYQAGYGNKCNADNRTADICWERLIMKNESQHHMSADEFKAISRSDIEKDGFSIVGLVGDQWSDLGGKYGPKDFNAYFKIPNPFFVLF